MHERGGISNDRIEEDMRAFITEETEKSESLEQSRERWRREDEGIETNQQDENENEI